MELKEKQAVESRDALDAKLREYIQLIKTLIAAYNNSPFQVKNLEERPVPEFKQKTIPLELLSGNEEQLKGFIFNQAKELGCEPTKEKLVEKTEQFKILQDILNAVRSLSEKKFTWMIEKTYELQAGKTENDLNRICTAEIRMEYLAKHWTSLLNDHNDIPSVIASEATKYLKDLKSITITNLISSDPNEIEKWLNYEENLRAAKKLHLSSETRSEQKEVKATISTGDALDEQLGIYIKSITELSAAYLEFADITKIHSVPQGPIPEFKQNTIPPELLGEEQLATFISKEAEKLENYKLNSNKLAEKILEFKNLQIELKSVKGLAEKNFSNLMDKFLLFKPDPREYTLKNSLLAKISMEFFVKYWANLLNENNATLNRANETIRHLNDLISKTISQLCTSYPAQVAQWFNYEKDLRAAMRNSAPSVHSSSTLSSFSNPSVSSGSSHSSSTSFSHSPFPLSITEQKADEKKERSVEQWEIYDLTVNISPQKITVSSTGEVGVEILNLFSEGSSRQQVAGSTTSTLGADLPEEKNEISNAIPIWEAHLDQARAKEQAVTKFLKELQDMFRKSDSPSVDLNNTSSTNLLTAYPQAFELLGTSTREEAQNYRYFINYSISQVNQTFKKIVNTLYQKRLELLFWINKVMDKTSRTDLESAKKQLELLRNFTMRLTPSSTRDEFLKFISGDIKTFEEGILEVRQEMLVNDLSITADLLEEKKQNMDVDEDDDDETVKAIELSMQNQEPNQGSTETSSTESASSSTSSSTLLASTSRFLGGSSPRNSETTTTEKPPETSNLNSPGNCNL